MFSVAGAPLFMPFLPLLPKQILLINFLSDLPVLMIASDSVDEEMVKKTRRWNLNFIRDFMITFGLVSSFFDYLSSNLIDWFYGSRNGLSKQLVYCLNSYRTDGIVGNANS